MNSLYKELMKYSKEDYYPMHMPGHKRNISLLHMDNPYALDITEIDGFDNLNNPQGIIKDIMNRAARLYQSSSTYLLINGSTVGILAAMAACTNEGDKVLVARNCHKAVYNGVILNKLNPIYVYPQIVKEFGVNSGLNSKEIEKMLKIHPDIKLIIITSPTYEGMISNVKDIVKVAHRYDVPCMVDEAHGAHLGLHKGFPNNSIGYGADIVIHSLHKTLPAFTQTGLLHVNSNLMKAEQVQKYLNMYQSSSPSYILMAGIEQCIYFMENKGEAYFLEFKKNLDTFYKKMRQLKYLRVFYGYERDFGIGLYDFDPSKILISVRNCNITGKELYQMLLYKYQIQLEMSSIEYALGMTSLCDTIEGFYRMEKALLEIDDNLSLKSKERVEPSLAPLSMKFKPYEASIRDGENVLLTHSKDRIAKEFLYVYPPGIPLIVPGEQITDQVIEKIKEYKRLELDVVGFQDNHREWIQVIKEE